ncbi:MAG: hypothetical protein JXR07_19920 [Reichenbachiella sp.]
MLHTSAGVFAVANNLTSDFDSMMTSSSKIDWEADPTFIQGKKLVPFGAQNNLPDIIRDIMDENNLAPGILEREIGLLYGEGPALYKVDHTDGQITRQFEYSQQIQNWLNDWDYKRFVDMAMVEYKYMKGIFAKRYLNRGGRIGRESFIKNLEVVPATDARLEWPESGPLRLESVKRIYTGDFTNNCLRTGIATYMKHDPRDPFRHRVSIGYHNKYSFGRSFYSVPSYYGSLKWIMRSSDIPDVLEHLGENGISSAYHIHSPEGYWKAKRTLIEKANPEKTEAAIEKALDDLKDEFFKKLSSVLTGKKNTGKFIDTVDFYDEAADEMVSWKIEAIDQKIDKYIKAQIDISEKADSATTSGMGLHPSLSNIIVGGQLSSGSQMLYALKLYMASDTSIPEEVIFEPINQAIAANFPNSDLRMGFYHPTVMKEEEVDPEKRVVNQDKKQ